MSIDMLVRILGLGMGGWTVTHFVAYVGTLVTALVLTTTAEAEAPDIADQAMQVLSSHCARCHHFQKSGSEKFDVLDRASLLDGGYVTEKTGDEAVTASPLWDKVASNEMPKGTPRKLTTFERRVIREWLATGSPLPDAKKRPILDDKHILTHIVDDLTKLVAQNDRPHQRYFTLANLHNDPTVTDRDMQIYRAALSKSLNSLSHSNTIYPPRAVDAEATIYRIDLRHYGWDRKNVWSRLLERYPYGVSYRHDPLADLASQISYHLTGDRRATVSFLRADWFVATATHPPLYHEILDIPKTVGELEKRLGVVRYDDSANQEGLTSFTEPRHALQRAGFAVSGVSRHNRMVERRSTRGLGGYWKSFDFKSSAGTANLFQFPLGPRFSGNPFGAQGKRLAGSFAFQHDGGEIIFPLNNGLQGYMLVDRDGVRLDSGAPIEIVQDAHQTSGTPAVVNGLSCINCHAQGMIFFADEVRTSHGALGGARDLVLEQYIPQAEMDEVLREDEARFLKSLTAAIKPFLSTDDATKLSEFGEPVGRLVTYYQAELPIQRVAGELGLNGPDAVRTAILSNPELIRVGLKPLSSGGLVKRETWESRDFLSSPPQRLQQVLDLADPVITLPEE
jgi:mono/diheme cytochrome c family protein